MALRLAQAPDVGLYDPSELEPQDVREDLRLALALAAQSNDGLGRAPMPRGDVKRALKALVRTATDRGVVKAWRLSTMAAPAADLFTEVAHELDLPVEALESCRRARIEGVREGERGTLEVYTVERGLTDDQVRYSRDFGWRPLRVNESRQRMLERLAPDGPWRKLQHSLTPAREALSRGLEQLREAATRSREAAELAAILTPVDVRTAFVLQVDGVGGRDGWTTITPRTQFSASPYRAGASMSARPVVELHDYPESLGQLPVLESRDGAVDRVVKRDESMWVARESAGGRLLLDLSGPLLFGPWCLEEVTVASGTAWTFAPHRGVA